MRTTTALLAALVVWLGFATEGSAQDSVAELLPSLTLDRIDDTSAVWRLGDFVQTADAGAPASPTPVYMQFGFMGCAPCEVLAELANELLPESVIRVYVHLDDVLLHDYGGSNQQLWRQLWQFSTAPPYDTFVTIRRGSTDLMQTMCGPDASSAPAGLLIQPDGTVFATLTSADEGVATEAFSGFAGTVE